MAGMAQARKSAAKKELLRQLPSVDELVRRLPELEQREGRAPLTEAVRAALDKLRAEAASGRMDERALQLAVEGLPQAVERELRRALEPSLRPVINATGVILHTNIGRAPLAEAALERICEVAVGYCNLEFDLTAGERGKRDVHLQRLFASLLGPNVSTVAVNNNAAAVLLALNSLAEGGEVIVSRGELVEIGGSFRVPEVMAKSGALLREVGTTNRTRIADYERAIGERTRLLLRVHRSNFQIVGFTEQPSLEQLCELGRKRGIPVMEDLGSGALFDLRSAGIGGESTVSDSLRAGVDVVTYSGDKLLGGPQAGLISGRPEAVARIRSNPLFRALRVDKLTYAALEATLLLYVRQEHDAIPAVRMMRLRAEEIEQRAAALAKNLLPPLRAELMDGESLLGGGSAPGAALPTRLLAITCDQLSADELAARLRASAPPILARVEEGRVLLDLRTVFPAEDAQVAEALRRIAAGAQ